MKLSNKQEANSDSWQGSMSDIAFLLIIFFILTTLFNTEYIIRLVTESASSTQNIIKEQELFTLEITQNGSWHLDNQKITRSELISLLDQDKKYRILVDNQRPYKDFIALLDILHEKDINQIEIVMNE